MKRNIAPLFIIVAALLWSLDGILRRSLYVVPSAVIVSLEHLFGFLVLTPIFLPQLAELKKLSRKEWLSIGVVSLFSGALGTILYTAALADVHFIQFSVVALLQQLQPIWAILAAALFLKEKITRQFVLWALLAVAGSYAITFKDLTVNISRDYPTIIAAVLALSAGVMWGTSTSFSKIVLKKASFITTTYLRFGLAFFFAAIIAVAGGQGNVFFHLTAPQLLTLVAITFSTGLVAILIYYYGLKTVKASQSAILELAWPVSAVFLDLLYFKNPLTLTQLMGAVVILYSMYSITRNDRAKEV
jgi:drug/metabolite transporter (DMT)-like permease